MPTKDEAILRLIEALTDVWCLDHTVEEIACDEDKVKLMIVALEAEGVPAEHTKTLYSKVFLRNVWHDKNNDGDARRA